MSTTANRGYRFPTSTDSPPDIPFWMNALATDLDGDVQNLYNNVARIGIVAAPLTTSSNGTPTSGTTETLDAVLGIYSFTALAGVRYRATLSGREMNGSVANDQYSFNLRYAVGGAPTSASTLIAGASHLCAVTLSAGREAVPISGTFMPGAGAIQVGVFTVRRSGTGVCTPTGACELYVESIGNI